MKSLRVYQIIIALVPALASAPLLPAGSAQETSALKERLHFFETRIRPLLHAKCVKCHGENLQKGALRLDSLESLLKGGESGAAAVPGKPAESLLLEAVRYESFEMPPDKPLSSEEIAHLQTWIADGAAWPQLDGKSVRLTGAAFTEEERNFWSLQPVAHVRPPAASAAWVRNPVDRFIAAKLQSAKIPPAPRAQEDVLIRRLYFDLLGVPPSPAEISEFKSQLSDRTSWATQFASLTDKLLADTRYGEHWGRYWLDIVRYAESDGFRADGYRSNAWRYRDYVVNAFNSDKPYDQFVTEQLAGDEVAPDRAEALTATGFLRTYLYEYNQRDARTQWQDILNQITDVTGEAFLGMGVGCARCHDHKFDPILQEDYYRLRACFGTMLPRDDVPAADMADRQRYSRDYEAWLAKGSELRAELDRLRQPYMKKAATSAITKFPEDIQEIMAKTPDDRNPLEAQLADLVNRQVVFEEERVKYSDEHKKRIDALEKQIAELAGKKPGSLPTAMTVADVGNTPFPLHVGGDTGRKAVTGGGFTIIASRAFDLQPTAASTGQRTALAGWITSPDNPLTARVIVNRVWQQHFGTGLVDTASDFGNLGGRPSHPELLDWLASEFVASGWSVKWLHRLILNSATWQMSAFHPNPEVAMKADPGNRLRWRFDIRRLNAEQIRDAILTASGELKSERGGPSAEHNSLRRSIYLKVLRNKPEPLMSSLDGVDGLNSIPKRSTTTTPTQALNLMNGEWVRQRSEAMAKRVLDEFDGTDPTGLVNGAFRIALGRGVHPDELPAAVKLISDAARARKQTAESDLSAELTSKSGPSIAIGEHGFAPPATTGTHPAMVAPFTFAGIFKLKSLYPNATVRTIISQWNDSKGTRGWSIGITSEKSAYKPRNFILQPVGDAGYEVVASNLRPELNRPYFAAVTVRQTDDGRGTATFYLQPVDAKGDKPETATVEFKTAAGFANDLPIVIGGRTKSTSHKWDGHIDQVALFNTALSGDDINQLFAHSLQPDAVKKRNPAAYWTFDDTGNLTAAAAGTGHKLKIETTKPLNRMERAVAELCHVLLNSNEFVYID